jgi:hypothetical protein
VYPRVGLCSFGGEISFPAGSQTPDPLLFQKYSFHTSCDFYILHLSRVLSQMDQAVSRNNLVLWCLIVTPTLFRISMVVYAPGLFPSVKRRQLPKFVFATFIFLPSKGGNSFKTASPFVRIGDDTRNWSTFSGGSIVHRRHLARAGVTEFLRNGTVARQPCTHV